MAAKRNILVLGSGGREHALAWKLRQSGQCGNLYCIPGNGGMGEIAECHDMALDDHAALAEFIEKNGVELTVVGPEQPLVEGIVDDLRERGHKIWGPDKRAARLEGSKAYSKEFMHRKGIPTAHYLQTGDLNEGLAYLADAHYPIVVKASGLAAGKGVLICKDRHEAENGLRSMLAEGRFGEAGETVVIEEFLDGEEISIFVLTDGKNYHILPTARDHKRAYENDEGPNTGGMGAFSPAPLLSENEMDFVREDIIEKTLTGLKDEEADYKGVIYLGLMITAAGIKVLEYNCRFGDPEAQVILPLLENDLVELIDLSLTGKLDTTEIRTGDRHCATVVLASGGYPGSYEKGLPIRIPDKRPADTIIFHAGTKRAGGELRSSGGRVLAVTSLAASKAEALGKCYELVEEIGLEGAFYRKDIGGEEF